MRQTREGELSEWQKPQHVDQMLPICQSKQLSLQQRGRPTIWRLIIDNLRLCCFLTPLPSLSLLSFLFPFLEIRHGAPTWKPPTCVWVCHEPFLLSVPCGAPYHPASIPGPLLLWHLPGRHRDPHISTHPPAQSLMSITSKPASRHRKTGVRPHAVKHSRS